MAVREEQEIECEMCGFNEFRLTRIHGAQIMAECIGCNERYLLDAITKKRYEEGRLLFWSIDDKVAHLRLMEQATKRE